MRGFFGIFFAGLWLSTAALAYDFAMSCPEGWTGEITNNRLEQCISPNGDALIEVHAFTALDEDLTTALDRHVGLMGAQGAPVSRMIRQVDDGNVSGIPAVTREYIGQVGFVQFHSYISISRKDGVDYVMRAMFDVKRVGELQPIISAAMNSWRYPSLQGTGRRYSRDQCSFDFCKPASATHSELKQLYLSDKPAYPQYRYIEDPYEWCTFEICRFAVGMTITCGREAMGKTMGEFKHCQSLGYDSGVFWSCWSPIKHEGLQRMLGECPELCVSGPAHAVWDTQASKRSPNIMAN